MLVHIHPFQLRFSYGLVSSQGPAHPGSAPRGSLAFPKPPSAQSPFALHRSSLLRCDLFLHIRERYSSFFALTDSCVSPIPSLLLQLSPRRWVFAGCHQSLLDIGPSRCYLCRSFPRCLDPYPGGFPWCSRPFLPMETSAFSKL